MPFDKKGILELLATSLEHEIASLRAGYESARRASVEAPGRMQSRYDSMGIEAGWVASGLAKNLDEKVRALVTLRSFNPPEGCKRVGLGVLLGIGAEPEKVEAVLFVLPVMGGTLLKIPGEDLPVRIVTPQSPLGSSLMGKTVGDPVALRGADKESEILFLE